MGTLACITRCTDLPAPYNELQRTPRFSRRLNRSAKEFRLPSNLMLTNIPPQCPDSPFVVPSNANAMANHFRAFLATAWAVAFCRKLLLPLNVRLFRLACQLIGVGNWHTPTASGEIRILRKLASTFDTVFDVGANKGQYLRQLLQYNPKARVFAFEAQPENFQELHRVPNVRSMNVAVGNRNGPTTIYDYASDNTEHATLFPSVFSSFHSYSSPLKRFDVDMIALDTFCSGAQIDQIDFLKIDVEGGEFDVLLGCRQLLARRAIKVIQFEFNVMNIHTGHLLRDFEALLDGYGLYRLCPTTLQELSTLPPVCKELFGYQNILAVRTDLVREITRQLR